MGKIWVWFTQQSISAKVDEPVPQGTGKWECGQRNSFKARNKWKGKLGWGHPAETFLVAFTKYRPQGQYSTHVVFENITLCLLREVRVLHIYTYIYR